MISDDDGSSLKPVAIYEGRHIRRLEDLCKLAEAVEPVGCSRLAACIVIGNKIVSYGTNQKKSHTFQAKYSKNPSSIFWHAETNAIFNALKYVEKEDLQQATLYIARIKFDSPIIWKRKKIWGLSCPCEGCMEAIDAFQIKKVIYTIDGWGYYNI